MTSHKKKIAKGRIGCILRYWTEVELRNLEGSIDAVEYNYGRKDGALELFNYYCDIPRFSEEALRKHKEDLYQLYDKGLRAIADLIYHSKIRTVQKKRVAL